MRLRKIKPLNIKRPFTPRPALVSRLPPRRGFVEKGPLQIMQPGAR